MTTLRAATAADAPAIAALYARYVRETAITFELEPPGADEVAHRIAAVQARLPWLVAVDAGTAALLGYAYAAPFNARAAYRWVAETTIYLAPDAQRRGLGRTLYAALLDAIAAQGVLAATALIALPNAASVRLHEALGFRAVGTFDRVGYKLGRWHDVGYWQKDLGERAQPPDKVRPPATR